MFVLLLSIISGGVIGNCFQMKRKRNLEIKKILYIKSQAAQAIPPLGTVLGNSGVNTVKFCEEFNKFTIGLPTYIVVKVIININENRTFSFTVDGFSIPFALKILKFKKNSIVFKNHMIFKDHMCIRLSDILNLCMYKFPYKPLQESFFILYGIIRSMKLIIVYN
jgi:ribosomal protein L11